MKRLATILIAAVLAVGCSAATDPQGNIIPSDYNAASRLTLDVFDVALGDGTAVTCIFANRAGLAGGLSCDWANRGGGRG